ncbi:ATP phosphoribosyltransferase regulatory subunit [hydrothermal vent metagenome]|uniref:ATP phosphoribosyltransferase regulatory subunit n=1 Tax=hydrothermal vent metagenome TaxID=652676 RepID=A0A3B0YJP3_9ZZZZ
MNKAKNRWLLPEGIEELLPEQAARLELLRREILDLYRSWGYELILPPFIEYLDSLLTGTGHDLDLKTFKLIDQLSGRLLGLRADMTPQAARIDAHHLQRQAPSRLCYLGTVLHTRPDGLAGSRSPLQVGAELFGHAGAESDVEILTLMVQTLALTGVEDVYIDLGHVGIYRGLAHDAALDNEQEAFLFDALQRKAIPEINEFLTSLDLSTAQRERLAGLATLNGDVEVLERATALLQGSGKTACDALENLTRIATLARQQLPDVSLHFDLAELRGYQYQTGVVFAAFVADHGKEVARGGRYNEIGKVFGRARPATGFSTDLRTLMRFGRRDWPAMGGAILAPNDDDTALVDKVRALRAAGKAVIRQLPGQDGSFTEMGCDQILRWNGSEWIVEEM